MDSKGSAPYSPMPQGAQFGSPSSPGYLSPQPGYPPQPGYQPAPPGYSPAPPGFAPSYQPPAPQYNPQTNVVVVKAPAATSTTVYRSSGDHYMTLSLVLTFLCFICGGWISLLCTIPAIMMASAAKGEDAAGRPAAAKQKANIALGLNIAAVIIHVVFAIILIVAITATSVGVTQAAFGNYNCRLCSYYISYSCTYAYSYSGYSYTYYNSPFYYTYYCY